jgi:CRP-like cAMP-binding protein
MKTKLRTALTFGGILHEKDYDLILDSYETVLLKPGMNFLSAGQVSDRIGFVEEGILRVFFITEKGTEVTKYFIRANQFGVDLESYYENKVSEYNMQAVVPTCVHYITRSKWTELLEKIPKLYIYTKSLTEATLLNKIKDNEFLVYGTAKEKYLGFLKRYPDLALHVPLQDIASYLQITPQSLSRIRKEI